MNQKWRRFGLSYGALLFTAPLFLTSSLLAHSECNDALKKLDRSITLARIGAKAGVLVRTHLALPTEKELAFELDTTPTEILATLKTPDRLIKVIQKFGGKSLQSARSKIANSYAVLVRSSGRIPTDKELQKNLYMNDKDFNSMIGPQGVLFDGMDSVKELARLERSASFQNAIDTDVFNDERVSAMLNDISHKSTLILTTAVAGSPVNRDAFKALLKMAEEKDAAILVWPSNFVTEGLDPALLNTPRVHILTNTVELTPKFRLWTIKILAKMINPLTGLLRLAPRGQTQFLGAPKFHVQTVATVDNEDFPHSAITTGAITNPNYSGSKYVQMRTDEIARHDHVVGAVVLEKTQGAKDLINLAGTTGSYNWRHIEFIPEKKGFMDLDKFYTASGVKESRPEALDLGDIHVGDLDQTLLTSLANLIRKLKPRRVVLHDLLNGDSVNHHDQDQSITLAKKAERGQLNVRAEISKVAAFLNALTALDPELQVIDVPSNHDAWLKKWLQRGDFVKDPYNALFGAELFKVYSSGQDPLKYALLNGYREYTNRDPHTQFANQETLLDGGGLDAPERVNFLEVGNDLKLGPDQRLVEVGLHGHAGANGAKGSLLSFEKATDRIVFGHTHTDQRKNFTVNIGTLTKIRLSYTMEGASSWVQSLAVIGENGEIQVLRFNQGEWNADPADTSVQSQSFFPPGYPKIIPNSVSDTRVGQIDQHSSSGN